MTTIELYMCENCETKVSKPEFPYLDDGGAYCAKCADEAYAKGDIAYEMWKERDLI